MTKELTHVVAFSGGIASAVCAKIVKDACRESGEYPILLFHDTKTEPADNARFRADVSNFLELPITEESDGRDIWQVFNDEGTLGNDRAPICSRILKQERCVAYLKKHFPAIIYFGFTAEEYDRAQRTFARYAKYGIEARFPLLEAHISKAECTHRVQHCWRLRTQSVYEWADHANCIPCIRGQLAYWGLIYRYHRDAWEKASLTEETLGAQIFHPERAGTLKEELPHCLKLAEAYLKRKDAERRQISLFEYPCECAI